MRDEVELSEGKDGYEVIPVTPVRRLEKRISQLEKAGSIPQLQSLIIQIVELIRTNQGIINEVIKANADLRNELSRLPSKIDDLTTTMKGFINMVESAGREEITGPGPEAMKPLVDEIKKMNEQTQAQNQAVLDSLEALSRKIRSGTPVSKLLSSYPGVKLRRETK